MSKGIYAAVVGTAVIVSFALPAEARIEPRIDNGPIASLYENDGRRSVQAPKRAKGERASLRRGTKKSAQSRSGSRRTAAERNSGSKLAARAVTAERSAGAGTSRGCLQAPARALLDRMEQQFGPVSVISTCRPGAVIAGSGKPSKHRYGLAVDFEAGGRKGAIVNWLRANHHSGGTMTYASMSHIHVDIGPHFVQLGAGGRRG
jgi:hypothetical protein